MSGEPRPTPGDEPLNPGPEEAEAIEAVNTISQSFFVKVHVRTPAKLTNDQIKDLIVSSLAAYSVTVSHVEQT